MVISAIQECRIELILYPLHSPHSQDEDFQWSPFWQWWWCCCGTFSRGPTHWLWQKNRSICSKPLDWVCNCSKYAEKKYAQYYNTFIGHELINQPTSILCTEFQIWHSAFFVLLTKVKKWGNLAKWNTEWTKVTLTSTNCSHEPLTICSMIPFSSTYKISLSIVARCFFVWCIYSVNTHTHHKHYDVYKMSTSFQRLLLNLIIEIYIDLHWLPFSS